MSAFKHGRYSGYLKPISYLLDLSIINGLASYLLFQNENSLIYYVIFALGWVLISFTSKFYNVYRYTPEVSIFALILKQMMIFTLFVFAFYGFNYSLNIKPPTIFKYVLVAFTLVTILKFAIYYLLQKYRSDFGGNYRNTIIIGKNKNTSMLEAFFKNNPEYGYTYKNTFNFKGDNSQSLEYCFQYIVRENIDEIYCSISELNNVQINEIIDFADNNLKILKFLPDNKGIFTKKLKYEYYDYIPVLSLRNIPMEDSANLIVKRAFDIIFSSTVIVFILSWLTPIIAILIKLESNGPVFFKQSRNGFNYKEFDCFKFRSMTPNKDAHLYQATRGDQRVTKVGKFIRKTSIDELPQFFNVLFGDMSVVGPRPHMVSHTNMYAKRIDKFMVRHFVKPGITGLAQISGFRGEVETDKDIIGRVKYDIFYIENWSLLLDLKIIIQTARNAIRGDEKAY